MSTLPLASPYFLHLSPVNPTILLLRISEFKIRLLGFPGGAVVKNLFANAGLTGSSPDLGKSHMPWSN